MSTLRPAITASLLLVASPLFAQQPPPAAPAPPAAPPPAAAPLPPPAGVAPPAAPEAAPLPEAPPPVEAAPPPPPPAPLPEAVPPPAVEEKKPEEVFPTKLSVGKSGGYFQPGALLQFWGRARKEPDTTTATTFRLRRLELRAKGEIAPKLVAYNAMIDVAKLIRFTSTDVRVRDDEGEEIGTGSVLLPGANADNSVLQDFVITFISDYADVSVGQFKNPVSLEGYGSASKILFPERHIVSTRYGDRRDIGLKIDKKIGDYFYYYAGLFNGSGQNRLDEDNEKDIALRLEAYPIKGLTVAALGYTTIGERDGNVRDRLEGDLKYDENNILFQAEYIHGWDGVEGSRIESHGVYGTVGYTFIERIQPLFRIGFHDNLDPDTDVRQTAIEGCVNYYLRGQEARLALSVSNFKAEGADDSVTEGILFAQASF